MADDGTVFGKQADRMMQFPLSDLRGELRALAFSNAETRTYLIQDFVTILVVIEKGKEDVPKLYAMEPEMFERLAKDLGLGAKA